MKTTAIQPAAVADYNCPVMRVRVKCLVIVLVLGFGCSSAVAASHPVPKDRAALTDRDWLPHVVSKIAPLEWWSFASSSSDLRREDFSSDYEYEQATADTYFPRFCFALFRPKPEERSALAAAVSEYAGSVKWEVGDGCIVAMPLEKTFTAPPAATREERQRLFKQGPPAPRRDDPEFVKRAINDVPGLAAWLEVRLGLKARPSLDFDPQWLTREGLAASRGQLEDYWEPGSWTVFLARKPQRYAGKFEPTSTEDRPLAFGIAAYEIDSLFDELSPGWEAFQDKDPVIPAYPLLSRLSDMTADALYDRNEVDALLDECVQTQARVKTPNAIRGLDNLVRIARWAQKLKVGIYFGAQNP